MPVIAVEVAEGLLSQVGHLVAQGDCASIGDFVETAIRRQLARSAGVPVAVGVVAPSRPLPASAQIARALAKFTARPPVKAAPASEPERSWKPGQESVRLRCNRLFGLKLACRWLSAAATEEWPRLSSCAAALAADVAEAGSALEREDAETGRDRDLLLATGLPRRGNMASHERFVSQTIGKTSRTGSVRPGAMLQYRLAVLRDDRLALTPPGVRFALLPNPLIDGGPGATCTFSADERKLLIRQVCKHAPEEWIDFGRILKALRRGKDTPEEVVQAVRHLLPHEWPEPVAQSYVAAAIGRMIGLGLVARHWSGRNVRYRVGPLPAKAA